MCLPMYGGSSNCISLMAHEKRLVIIFKGFCVGKLRKSDLLVSKYFYVRLKILCGKIQNVRLDNGGISNDNPMRFGK